IKRRHAKETQINMHNTFFCVSTNQTKFCEHLGEILLKYLKNSKKEDIMMFFEWMLDTYKGIKKQVSVHSYKRRLFQIYHKSVGEDFNDGNKDILDITLQYINGYLTIQYNLDTSEKEKPVMNVDDVYLVQHHLYVHDTSIFPDERQRIQLALLILLQAYTATRPRAVQIDDGTTRTSPTLHYHTNLYYLQRLGISAGFMQLLSPYVIRRGAGEGVEAVASQPQLQQVMGHRDAGVYQAYMNRQFQVDTIAAFLGRPSANALMKAASHMSRFVDSRAPTTASPEELAKLRDSSNLAQLVELRDNL
ncbi:hypothetical protein EDB81DRAFT_606118, partial [Dactylonectria macrodidyma]